MAVANQIPINSYTANGATTVFNFSFQTLFDYDVLVLVNNVAESNYTLSGIGTNSGSVTFTTAPANGSNVVIQRSTNLQRQTDYQVNGDLLSDSFNKDYDRLWMALQDLKYITSLAPHLKAGSAAAGLLEIPTPAALAAK